MEFDWNCSIFPVDFVNILELECDNLFSDDYFTINLIQN